MNRRDFLKLSGWGTACWLTHPMLSLAAAAPAPPSPSPSHASGNTNHAGNSRHERRKGDMLYRPLGRTGEWVSAIGMGGAHIGSMDNEQDAIRLIRSAVDRGITFMDNSWDYHNGESEKRKGKALRDGYRQKVFLMTKIDSRNRIGAEKQLNESLKRLQVDHVDLLQVHEVIRMDDPERSFAKGGAIEAVKAAKTAGKIRYIGFTGHKDPAIHLHMLDLAAQHGFRFDTVQMPLNVMDAHFRSFEKLVLPRLLANGIGVLGMKTLADGWILKSKTATPIECLHYALNLPTSTVITGIDSPKILDQALEATRTFRPMPAREVSALLRRTAKAAQSGEYERFKISNDYDSTVHHPEWLD